MTKIKISLAAFAAIAFAGIAYAQTTGGFWSNWPIVGGASYSCGSVNAVSNCTVPAGPTDMTGTETFPANTGLSGGSTPQNVLVTAASLNANPITFVTVTSSNPTAISASNLSGGVVYVATGTITAANITLPASPRNNQQYAISSNRTITTLSVAAASGDAIASNTSPTALTASTTAVNGYRFICRLVAGVCTWSRLQ